MFEWVRARRERRNVSQNALERLFVLERGYAQLVETVSAALAELKTGREYIREVEKLAAQVQGLRGRHDSLVEETRTRIESAHEAARAAMAAAHAAKGGRGNKAELTELADLGKRFNDAITTEGGRRELIARLEAMGASNGAAPTAAPEDAVVGMSPPRRG